MRETLEHTAGRARRLLRREEGTQLIELSIVLPILVLLFAGTVELGRLFHTYTTLTKSTRAGARYLSASKNFSSVDPAKKAAAVNAAKNLVVCGYTGGCCDPKTDADKCTGQGEYAPVADGITVSNVQVDPLGVGPVRYANVSITGYNYKPLVFDLNVMTGSTAFTPALAPSTRMRYMP